jgi:protoheme IX farnesyltransferase
MKPAIVGLVLVSTLTGMYIGGRGAVELSVALWTLAGVGLATAGAAVLNNYIDRDIDALMPRTAARALARGSIDAEYALILGTLMVGLSMSILLNRVGVLTALLTAVAVFIYVVLYAMILKRRTPLANQIGGLAGALPPVLGITAVTGALSVEALILFAIVALWQQPHALSLALKYRSDYAKASIPVIPVAKGVRATKLRILLYTSVLVPVSTLLFLTGMAGLFYLVTALVLGGVWFFLSLRFWRSKRQCDMFLFFYSILYLTLVFSVLVFDMV